MTWTWSLQLTAWALAPLLAVLLVLRDLGFLWPRRREPGAVVLLALAATCGAWALCHLAGMTATSLDGKVLVARIEYVPAALAPVVLAWFGFAFVRRRRELRRWPMLLLYALTLVTLVLALRGPEPGALFRNPRLVARDGVVGLVLDPGPWHWVHLAVRAAAVVGTAVVLGGHLARRPGSRLRSLVVAAAAALALGPTLFHLSTRPGAWWTNVSSAGFALATTVLASGLLRHRLLGLGPVARTLVMEELRDPVVVLDEKGRIVDVNREAEQVLGLEPYGPVPLPLGTLWASSRPEPDQVHRVVLATAPDGGGDDEEGGGEGVEEDRGGGPERTFEVTITPLGGSGGEGRSALLLRDVTVRDRMERELRRTHEALRDANRELERLAHTDGLTGLANRRYFMDRLSSELERSDRYERPLSLIVLDLDHFKEVNDTHGHAAGDAVLKAAAEALRSVCRDVDVPARVGGEEMALLLPETARSGARTVAERVRVRIERRTHTAPDGATFGVTASLGVAAAGAGARTAEELLQRADEALYRAKDEGRNRVTVAT